jgi:hypothetical protein
MERDEEITIVGKVLPFPHLRLVPKKAPETIVEVLASFCTNKDLAEVIRNLAPLKPPQKEKSDA